MNTEIIDKLQAAITAASPVMAGSVKKMKDRRLENWQENFSETLSRVFPSRHHLSQAAKAYTRYAMEVTMHQHRFSRVEKYQCSCYAEVAKNVYLDDSFMAEIYLPAVLLSHYLWYHHYQQQLFFQKMFLPMIDAVPEPTFCEVGLGSGLYSRLTLSRCKRARGHGYDVSGAAVAFTLNHIASFALQDRWIGEINDIESVPPEKRFSHAICVEVLEHLEEPEKLLCSLRKRLITGAKAFIVAAVTAAEYDHIYLYTSADEVQAHLESAGFDVDFMKVFPAPGYSDHRYPPRLAAFIVERR